MSRGVRAPETTSSPWALGRKSPLGSGAPVTSSRLKASPGDAVLALGVGEEVAAGLGRSGDLVAAEGDAGAGGVALVAEDHLLDVDRRSPLVRDAVDAPVLLGPVTGPGVEHRADREPQLLLRILRELFVRVLLI